MQRALPNPRKKVFPGRALQLPAVALAAPPRLLAPVSLRFLYIQNNGMFPKNTDSCCQRFRGSPWAWSYALLWGLRSHKVCSNVLAERLSHSLREMSGSACPTGNSRGFVHHTWASTLGPAGSLHPIRGSQAELPSLMGPREPAKGVKPKPWGRCLDLSVSPALGTG